MFLEVIGIGITFAIAIIAVVILADWAEGNI